MKKSNLDFEKRFGRVLGELRRRFPEHRWILEMEPGNAVAAMVCAPEGEEEMVLGLTLADSSPKKFLEGVLEDVGPCLLGRKAGFSSLEELDLFLESVGKGRDFT
jgi:hypothetical protein